MVFQVQEPSAAIDQGLEDLLHAPANLKDQISAILHLVVGEVRKPRCVAVPQSRAQNTNRSGKSTAHRPDAIALQPVVRTRSLRSFAGKAGCVANCRKAVAVFDEPDASLAGLAGNVFMAIQDHLGWEWRCPLILMVTCPQSRSRIWNE